MGLLFAAAPLAEYFHARHVYAGDVAGVNQLGANLKAAKQSFARASTAADSARLASDIKEREFYFGQRAYHLSYQKAHVDNAWKLGSLSTILIAAGFGMIAVAAVQLRRGPRPTA